MPISFHLKLNYDSSLAFDKLNRKLDILCRVILNLIFFASTFIVIHLINSDESVRGGKFICRTDG